MDTDAPTPEQAAQALNQIDRHQSDAVHRTFWAPWWYKLSIVVVTTGLGLSFDLTNDSWRLAAMWGSLLGLFALAYVQRRHAGVRRPTFGPQQQSVRGWTMVAGVLGFVLGMPVLLGWLKVPLPHAITYFAFSFLGTLVGTLLAPRQEAKRIAALADPTAIEAASRETFASRHSTRQLWLIYLCVILAVTVLVVGLVVAASALGFPGYVVRILPVAGTIVIIAAALLTLRWFQRPVKGRHDVERT